MQFLVDTPANQDNFLKTPPLILQLCNLLMYNAHDYQLHSLAMKLTSPMVHRLKLLEIESIVVKFLNMYSHMELSSGFDLFASFLLSMVLSVKQPILLRIGKML
jgi:hypothetical protein